MRKLPKTEKKIIQKKKIRTITRAHLELETVPDALTPSGRVEKPHTPQPHGRRELRGCCPRLNPTLVRGTNLRARPKRIQMSPGNHPQYKVPNIYGNSKYPAPSKAKFTMSDLHEKTTGHLKMHKNMAQNKEKNQPSKTNPEITQTIGLVDKNN